MYEQRHLNYREYRDHRMSNRAANTHPFCIWRQFYRALVADTMVPVLMVDNDKCQQIRLPLTQLPQMALVSVADV